MESLPTTATGTLSLLPETKEQIDTFAAMIREEVLSGTIDILPWYIKWKAINRMVELVEKDEQIKAAVLREAEKYGAKTFELHGAKVTVKEVGVRYDFSQCGSTAWQQRKEWVDNHTASLKGIEEWLKKLPEKGGVDPDTGEALFPPVRKSTTSVSIELK